MKGGIYINQLFLVGRLVRTPEIKNTDGKLSCIITLAVKRNYKNADGIFETDFITCSVWNIIAEKVCEYCQKGDLISVKARVQNNNYLDKEEKMVYSYEFIAEQVSFLQNSKNNDKEEDSDVKEIKQINN